MSYPDLIAHVVAVLVIVGVLALVVYCEVNDPDLD